MKKNVIQTVAELLTSYLNISNKTIEEISFEAGFDNPEVVHQFFKGTIKIPFEKIGVLSEVLSIDSDILFHTAIREYLPETCLYLRPSIFTIELSESEIDLIFRTRLIKQMENIFTK